MDNYEKETALIEAVLFLETNPLDYAAISGITGLPEEIITVALDKIKEQYSSYYSGIELSCSDGVYSLSPKHEYWEQLKDRYGKKSEGEISRAALETLSIIAYSQPVTRAEIEAIRGVSADNMIRLLLKKKLIEEVGKRDVPGKPVQFGTTREFLEQFRLNSISELPRLSDSEADRFEIEPDPLPKNGHG